MLTTLINKGLKQHYNKKMTTIKSDKNIMLYGLYVPYGFWNGSP